MNTARFDEGGENHALASAASGSGELRKIPPRPTDDQMYLMDKINFFTERGGLTPAAINRLNKKHGKAVVVSSMRQLRVAAEEHVLGITSAYAYLDRMCSVFTGAKQ